MAVRLTRAWRPLDEDEVARVPGQLGVYEIADEAGRVLYVGAAEGRSLFGLRGEVTAWLARHGDGAARFRFEVTSTYTTRRRELLMVHVHDTGALPPLVPADEAAGLGRLTPG